MAAKQVDGDGISANLAGMSKNQLYDIMCQMKMLIEQNQQQARQILIQNPLLTKALFQAQIMLGMVQPPQAIPTIQPTVALPRTQPVQPVQQANIQTTQALPGQNGSKDQTSSAPQISSLTRNQHQNPPAIPVPPASSASPFNLPTQSFPPHALQPVVQQTEGQHISNQATTMSLPQSSQLPNISPLPHHSASHTPPLQPPMSIGSTPLQQSLQKSVIQHLPLQPPLPPQPRLPSMTAFSHQLHSQIGQNAGFQHHSGAPQMHHSQNMFHLGNNPPSGMRPSFQQGQPPLPSQPPPQSLYQPSVADVAFTLMQTFRGWSEL
ncbi:cleavage stimulating factor 64 isoform X3 [Rhododendron vialii]|uniref:cleavage stimulating factor 64 isoform X3 n=1 Tax=Rhododendron vialii TaxID=182163 RepID=UPI00265D7E1C|nr:cleavage stimulating factor 64 isoform X3 [Rhododendron vialii]